MKRLKEFFKSAVIGGLLVVLPSAIFLFIVTWMFGAVRGVIRVIAPITSEVPEEAKLLSVGVDPFVVGAQALALAALAIS